MVDLWMPGAIRVPSSHNGGSMTGRDKYCTWHTYQCDYSVSAVAGARALIRAGNEVTLCFNPIAGQTAQMLSPYVAARGLVNLPGGVETNRQGSVNVQIEVIARAERPWTQDITPAGRAGLARIIAWLDSLGVPRQTLNGPIGPGISSPKTRSVTAWNGGGGHFCHGDVPENLHWDHGRVNIRDLWAIADAINHPTKPTPPTTSKEWYLMADIPDANLRQIWGFDGIPAPAPADPKNPNWTPASYLYWSFMAARQARDDAAQALAIVKKLAAAQGVSID